MERGTIMQIMNNALQLQKQNDMSSGICIWSVTTYRSTRERWENKEINACPIPRNNEEKRLWDNISLCPLCILRSLVIKCLLLVKPRVLLSSLMKLAVTHLPALLRACNSDLCFMCKWKTVINGNKNAPETLAVLFCYCSVPLLFVIELFQCLGITECMVNMWYEYVPVKLACVRCRMSLNDWITSLIVKCRETNSQSSGRRHYIDFFQLLHYGMKIESECTRFSIFSLSGSFKCLKFQRGWKHVQFKSQDCWNKH